jgi:hypothetical protein
MRRFCWAPCRAQHRWGPRLNPPRLRPAAARRSRGRRKARPRGRVSDRAPRRPQPRPAARAHAVARPALAARRPSRPQGFASVGKPAPGCAYYELLLMGCGEVLQWLGEAAKRGVPWATAHTPLGVLGAWHALPAPLLLVAVARVAEGLLVPE